jgi:ATP-dependent RNA helicase RhlB
MSEPHISFTSFDSLGLEPALAQGIRDAGFVNCTPIQAQTLPVALAG